MTGAVAPVAAFPPERSLALRRRQRLEDWRRRSRLIHRLRKLLPAAIVGLLVLLIGWVAGRGLLTRFGDLNGLGGLIHMANARFYGRDGAGKAYVLAASEAARDGGDPHRIQLHNMLLALDSGGPHEMHIAADTGVYHEDTHILLLRGHVVLRDAGGDNFLTDQAIIDTAHGAAFGQGRVNGWGPMGTITAQTFSIFNQGQRIVFRGEVHSIIKRR
jgi:lipopolysaccharide export system protein LptC